ncbi:ThuA domain-containing protein [Neobacillus cucumis]|uniref:Trehalose utilization n=1 Tax=Neobacillus cucumis TaxID=1740721 RepID=A0A2N5H6A5_9BACI|nr:ThuA domain-containing protein [Neobacillus cucumis]PLS01067.1 trehalose utilization [Neobacillus cucumis]
MKVKVLAVLGDFYHPADGAKASLEKAIRSISDLEEIELTYCSIEALKDALLDEPAVVILFKENRLNPTEEVVNQWMTEDLALEITTYVSNGGSLMAWHSGLASYPDEGVYTKMLRGSFVYHPDKHQLVQYTAGDQSFISSPLSFAFLDEHYFVRCDQSNTNVFLHSESIDGQSIAGWSHSYGDGKVCCLTPAHTNSGLQNQEFLTVLGSCIKWLVS